MVHGPKTLEHAFRQNNLIETRIKGDDEASAEILYVGPSRKKKPKNKLFIKNFQM